MKKRSIAIALSIMFVLTMLTGCAGSKSKEAADAKSSETTEAKVDETASGVATAASEDKSAKEAEAKVGARITIIYTNDVHASVDNSDTDDNGNEIKGLSYDSLAAMKKDLIAAGENVLMVDAGDSSQGTIYGSIDEAKSLHSIIDEVGYDAMAIGNHEFDYGQFRALDIIGNSKAPYICCNFFSLETNETVVDPYKVFDIDGTKVAFVGITTPETITASAPKYFQNEKGEFIFKISAGGDGKDLYDQVQKTVDAAKAEADYVIALGHCGIDGTSAPYRSIDIIENVSGLTAFIDGHSHSVVEGDLIKDKDGKDVVLTQTGKDFAAIGKMVISPDGKVSTELISEYENRDDNIGGKLENLIKSADDKLGEKIATSDIDFYIMDPKNPELRIVRNRETNLGDIYTDAFYWYFNEVEGLNCDVAISNGGAFRTGVNAGDWTYVEAKNLSPFGNVICLVEVTGQNIIDALEHGAFGVGMLDADGNEYQFGGFLHVSGVKYDIDPTIESTETMDENRVWQKGPSGDYKVSNVQIYNRELKKYEPIDPDKKYAIGGINYILRNAGNGMEMFAESEVIKDYVGEDYLIFSEYLKAFKANGDGVAVISSENSPLASYDGFGIDYENPLGGGRINSF